MLANLSVLPKWMCVCYCHLVVIPFSIAQSPNPPNNHTGFFPCVSHGFLIHESWVGLQSQLQIWPQCPQSSKVMGLGKGLWPRLAQPRWILDLMLSHVEGKVPCLPRDKIGRVAVQPSCHPEEKALPRSKGSKLLELSVSPCLTTAFSILASSSNGLKKKISSFFTRRVNSL